MRMATAKLMVADGLTRWVGRRRGVEWVLDARVLEGARRRALG